MTEDKEAFLDRWSRLKRDPPQESPALPVEKAEKAGREEPVVALPPVDELKPDSDFRPFMAAKVDPETRRSALKKLFTDAHYNVPDPFEAYSEDYTRSDPIPLEMLKTLNQAKRLLFDEPEKTAQAATESNPGQADATPPDTPPQDPNNVAGKQDA